MAEETTDIPVTTTEATDSPQADVASVEAVAAEAVDGTVLGGDAEETGDAPDDGSDPKDGSDGQEAAGPPETYELKAPDGIPFDDEAFKLAEPVLRELNLDNDQAQKLVDVYAAATAKAAETANANILSEVTAQRKAWADEAKADPVIGGANWEATQTLAAKALDGLGYPKGSSFRSFLTESGLGNHPEMIRAFRTVGERMGEDSDFVRGDGGAQVKLPREAVLYPNDVRKEGA